MPVPLVKMQDGHYALDLRPVSAGVVVEVFEGGWPFSISIDNATIREVSSQPKVLLPRRRPNAWYQAGRSSVGPIEIRVPKGTVWTPSVAPWLKRDKWMGI